jgi:CheY-like chemotaxis protein
VDDNANNLKLARDVLLAAGFRTLEAATAGEGIALANEHRPDVVLMDLRLPDIDGADVARRLANGARTAAIPVVAFSSLAFDDDTAWLRHAGFAGYLEKPIDVEEFPDQVRGYCSG